MKRFSLRTLIIVVTLSALLMGYVAIEYRAVVAHNQHLDALGKEAHLVFADRSKGLSLRRWLGMREIEGIVGIQTDAAMEHLAHAPSLRKLVISGQVTDDAFAHIAACPQLEILVAPSAGITNDGIQHLEGLKQLRGLYIHVPSVTDQGLAQLTGFPELHELHVASAQATGRGLGFIAQCPKLQKLILEGDQLEDSVLEHVEPLADLSSLQFAETSLSYAAVGKMLVDAQGKTLQDVLNILDLNGALQGERLDADFVEFMAEAPGHENVGNLDIRLPQLPNSAFDQLAKFESLRMLTIHFGPEQAVAWEKLASLKNLRDLNLFGTRLDREFLAGMSHLHKLKRIWFRYDDYEPGALQELAGLPNLAMLNVEGMPIRDEELRHINKLPALERLYLGKTLVSDDGVERLAEMESIRVLRLSHCSNITGSTFDQLAKLPQLEELSLAGPKITDATLNSLYVLKHLQRLSLSDAAITKPAFDKLVVKLPHTSVSVNPPLR